MYKNEYQRVLEIFFKNPNKDFYIREIAKLAKVSPGFSKKATDEFLREGLLTKRDRGNLVLLRGNLGSLVFRHMKITHSLRKILKSSLLDYLERNLTDLKSVILFGSVARGEDDENSDLDLLVIGKGSLNQTELENVIRRRTSLIKCTSDEWKNKARLDRAFYERILIDGIPLYGEFEAIL